MIVQWKLFNILEIYVKNDVNKIIFKYVIQQLRLLLIVPFYQNAHLPE